MGIKSSKGAEPIYPAASVTSYADLLNSAPSADLDLAAEMSRFLFLETGLVRSMKEGPERQEESKAQFRGIVARVKNVLREKKVMPREKFLVENFRFSAAFYLVLARTKEAVLVYPSRQLLAKSRELNCAALTMASMLWLGKYSLARLEIELPRDSGATKEEMKARRRQLRKVLREARRIVRHLDRTYYAYLIAEVAVEMDAVDSDGEEWRFEWFWKKEKERGGGAGGASGASEPDGSVTYVATRLSVRPVERYKILQQEAIGWLYSEDDPVSTHPMAKYRFQPFQYTLTDEIFYYPRLTVADLFGNIKAFAANKRNAVQGFQASIRELFHQQDVKHVATGNYGKVYVFKDTTDGNREKAIKYFDLRASEMDLSGITAGDWYRHVPTLQELFVWRYVDTAPGANAYVIPCQRLITINNELQDQTVIPAMLGAVMPLARGDLNTLGTDLHSLRFNALGRPMDDVVLTFNNQSLTIPQAQNQIRWMVTEQMIKAVYWLNVHAGVIHHDIKPQNFLFYTAKQNLIGLRRSFDDNERTILGLTLQELASIQVKLADFGLAILANEEALNDAKYQDTIKMAYLTDPRTSKEAPVPRRQVLQYDGNKFYSTWWRPLERWLFAPQVIDCRPKQGAQPAFLSEAFKSDVFALALSIQHVWGIKTQRVEDIQFFVHWYGFLEQRSVETLIEKIEAATAALLRDPNARVPGMEGKFTHPAWNVQGWYRFATWFHDYLELNPSNYPEPLVDYTFARYPVPDRPQKPFAAGQSQELPPKDPARPLLRTMMSPDWLKRPSIQDVMECFAATVHGDYITRGKYILELKIDPTKIKVDVPWHESCGRYPSLSNPNTTPIDRLEVCIRALEARYANIVKEVFQPQEGQVENDIDRKMVKKEYRKSGDDDDDDDDDDDAMDITE